MRTLRRHLVGIGLLVVAAALIGPGPATGQIPDHRYHELKAPVEAGPAVPLALEFPVQLIHDDGSAEGSFGVGGVTARQFLWFQVFDPTVADFDLHELWVLFPQDPEIAPGAPIQLVVYRDDDDDPSSGAELLAAIESTVQVADGATFSIYPLAEPVPLRTGGRTLIGAISRFVTSGTTPPTQPAALDTGSSLGSSWVATWNGDPPALPTLPPNESLFPVDVLVPGNWMIRGFGTVTPIIEIPALGGLGLVLLATLLAGLGTRRLARRRPHPNRH